MSKPITKALLKRCQNENLQCLAGLRKTDPEAAAAIEETAPGNYRDFLTAGGTWTTSDTPAELGWVYRLSPGTPTEPEYVDRPVAVAREHTRSGHMLLRCVAPNDETVMLITHAACHKDCLGFLYGTPEAPVLRTVLDLQYGQPFAVRFRVGS